MVNEFKLTIVHLHAQTRCRSVHARGFTAEQKNLWKISTGPLDRQAVAGRGPWPAGLLLAKPGYNRCGSFVLFTTILQIGVLMY